MSQAFCGFCCGGNPRLSSHARCTENPHIINLDPDIPQPTSTPALDRNKAPKHMEHLVEPHRETAKIYVLEVLVLTPDNFTYTQSPFNDLGDSSMLSVEGPI